MFLLTHRLLHSLPAQAYILLLEQLLCVPGGSTGTWLHAGVLSFLQTNSLRVCPQTPEYVEDVDASYRQNAVQNDDVDSCGDWGDVRTLCWDELNTPQLESFSGVLKSHQQERPASLHGTLAARIISVGLQAFIKPNCRQSAPVIRYLTSCYGILAAACLTGDRLCHIQTDFGADRLITTTELCKLTCGIKRNRSQNAAQVCKFPAPHRHLAEVTWPLV